MIRALGQETQNLGSRPLLAKWGLNLCLIDFAA